MIFFFFRSLASTASPVGSATSSPWTTSHSTSPPAPSSASWVRTARGRPPSCRSCRVCADRPPEPWSSSAECALDVHPPSAGQHTAGDRPARSLRVGEVVDYVGGHFGDRVPTAELAEEFGFAELLRRQTGSLSGGQKRRLSVALAFVGRPRLVLLDEPTTGLDVDARRALWAAIRRQHASGATVVVTSHYLEEIEALAERVIVMGSGRVLADDDLPVVLARVGLSRVGLRTRSAADRRDPGHRPPGTRRRARTADRGGCRFLRPGARHRGADFRDLTVRGATLEEAFLSLTDSAATMRRIA